MGQTRTSAEIFLFTFPLSGLGTVMMIPAAPHLPASPAVRYQQAGCSAVLQQAAEPNCIAGGYEYLHRTAAS
ncbi:hypothetical protein ABZ413_30080 [Nocardia rhamnosiphila]|uniref:hypothetical protein n=1 Tax=Nocardia rhamnosiphila TaxID=426716 RepID=UPI0033ED6A3E